MIVFYFFFSSRRRHTRWNCDWSSELCSSDLLRLHLLLDLIQREVHQRLLGSPNTRSATMLRSTSEMPASIVLPRERSCWWRSEERRVGKSVDLGGRRIIKRKIMKMR